MHRDMDKHATTYVDDTGAESDSSYDFTDEPPSYTSRPELPVREKPGQSRVSSPSTEAYKKQNALFKRLLSCFVDPEPIVDYEPAVPAGKPRVVPHPDVKSVSVAAPRAKYKDAIAHSPQQDILPALMSAEFGSQGDPWYRHNDTRYYTNDQSMRGWFSHSSKSIMLVFFPDSGPNLVAECSTVSGTRKVSMLALDDIISNWDGHFKWVGRGQQGKFSLSAKAISLEDGGRRLVAELGKVDGSWRKDTIRLDEMISNDDGKLIAIHHDQPVYAHDAI